MESRLMRYAEAYVRMANEARYRPRAPGDGCGNISLTDKQLAETSRLKQEAVAYAKEFNDEEDDCAFTIGCSDYDTNRAFVYTVEAARVLCGGVGGDKVAIRLLEMAIKDVKAAQKQGRRKLLQQAAE